MTWFPLGLASGVFVGNLLFHGLKGEPGKGAVIGLIAALLVIAFYGIIHLFRSHHVRKT